MKNVFKKYPITSLSLSNFIAVWLVPLFLLVGFNLGVLLKSIIVFWGAIPLGIFSVYAKSFSNIGRLPYELMNSSPVYTYILFVAPFSVLLIAWLKKKIAGTLTLRDIAALFVLCFLLPVMYAYTYVYIYAFWNASFIL